MIPQSKATLVAMPVMVKIALSAGQLIFAGMFLAVGFQIGHTICRKGIEYFDHRKLAKAEKEVEEPDDTGSVPNGAGK